jgi:hypothetical protein
MDKHDTPIIAGKKSVSNGNELKKIMWLEAMANWPPKIDPFEPILLSQIC